MIAAIVLVREDAAGDTGLPANRFSIVLSDGIGPDTAAPGATSSDARAKPSRDAARTVTWLHLMILATRATGRPPTVRSTSTSRWAGGTTARSSRDRAVATSSSRQFFMATALGRAWPRAGTARRARRRPVVRTSVRHWASVPRNLRNS
jgi:hypothetical protein